MKNIPFSCSVHALFLAFLFSCSSDTGDRANVKTEWIKHPQPVLRKGEPFGPDFYAISDCWVVFDEGEYKMWYTGGGAVYPDTVLHSNIGYATSPDGKHWTKHNNNPVLDVDKNAWDSLGVETVTVIIDESPSAQHRFHMWYAGQTYNAFRYEIGYAYSDDGLAWTKHPGPVLRVGDPDAWDNCFLEGPSVIFEDGQYKMWYAAYDCNVNGQTTDGKVNIGYALSDDGINWEKFSGNPVLTTTTNAWDDITVQDPHVISYNGQYHMWYGGTDREDNYFQQTGYAWSDDGITWTKSAANPVLQRGAHGQWDANTASFPSVMIKGGSMYMWYTGNDVEPLPAWPTPYYWEIGLAEKALPGSSPLD